jgi:hypothetical protein
MTAPEQPDDAAGADRAAIEHVLQQYFGAFSTAPGLADRLAELRRLFVPGALIVRTCGQEPAGYDVEAFLAPRETLLSDGAMQEFREWPLDGRLDVYRDIAQWFGGYAKSWQQDGRVHRGQGMKSIQFVRTAAGWQISAVVWDDEPSG